MDVDEDTGVGALVGAGEVDGGGASGTAAGDGDLVARHVELGTTRAASGVESDDFGAEQIIAGGDVGGDLDLHLAAAVVEILDAPEVVIAGTARGVLGPCVLEDLEPARGTVGGGGVGDLGHVHHDGAVVGTADGLGGAGAVVGLLVVC